MRKKFFFVSAIILIILFGRLLFEFARLSPVFLQFFLTSEIQLKKTDQRVNILLLGIGGEQHDGPLLTDTIIYASIDPEKKKVTLVSLPRDLWIPDLKAKINIAYAFAEEKKKGGGILLAKNIVEKILNQPVDYVLRIDFRGFIKAIDLIGGIDVEIERSFEDFEYPLAGKEQDTCGFEGEEFQKRATDASVLKAFPCRFEHISFQKGVVQMNGETALKFVRSRHSKSEEGADMARSKRQEKIIQASKDKILSIGTFLNPVRLTSLYDLLRESIDTDIAEHEYDDFIKLFQKVKDAQMQSVVFFYTTEDEKPSGFLINPKRSPLYGNQWVLIPRSGNGNFLEIQNYVSCVLTKQACAIP